MSAHFSVSFPATFAFASAGAGLDSVVMAAKDEYAACVALKGPDACKLRIHASSLVTKELMLALVLLGARGADTGRPQEMEKDPCRSQMTARSA